MPLSRVKNLLMELSERSGKAVWKRIPESALSSPALHACGAQIHKIVSRANRLPGGYCPCTFTRFFRNVPLLEALRDLVASDILGSNLTVASIGCSTGAELYSLLWLIHGARPDLRVTAHGVDLSASVVKKASAGRFAKTDEELSWLSDEQVNAIFVEDGEALAIKRFPHHHLEWGVGDVLDPALSERMVPMDLVMANNFLGAFREEVVQRCLDNLSRMVKPGGFLVVFGMDLDFKTRWVKRHGYAPVGRGIEQIHRGDRAMLDWPWTRWGMEPVNKRRDDWKTRYAAIFQAPEAAAFEAAPRLRSAELHVGM